MYRLITPIVDFACQKTGWEAFFEYNQTSLHGTSQSVDIALQDQGVPKVLVEAKRANRKISRQQIEKYLEPGLTGVVSNGADWILCRDNGGWLLSIWDQDEGQISKCSVESIVEFITGSQPVGEPLDPEQDIKPSLRPKRPVKAQVAQRKSHEVILIHDRYELGAFKAGNDRLTDPDSAFLAALTDALSDVPATIQIEARETRLSIWETSTGRKIRQMRIEFGKRQPSVLVRTALLKELPSLEDGLVHHRHDKHGGMREFRLADEAQAQLLGERIGTAISTIQI